MNGDDQLICPCDAFEHPLKFDNPPGQARLRRRIGSFTTFRRALLESIPSEEALQLWSARDKEDLGVMLLEMWAYLADILTFYDQEIANESYLRTAQRQPAVRRLTKLLSYRPRPGIGAKVQLAAFADSGKTLTVPAGLQIQSKPPPGEQPQVFEVTADTPINAGRNAWLVMPSTAEYLSVYWDRFLVEGKTSALKRDDWFLIVDKSDPTDPTLCAYVQVERVQYQTDALGRTNTLVHLTVPLEQRILGQKNGEVEWWRIANLRLLRPRQKAGLGLDPAEVSSSTISLDVPHPAIRTDDLVLVVRRSDDKGCVFKVVSSSIEMREDVPRTWRLPGVYLPYTKLELDGAVSTRLSETPEIEGAVEIPSPLAASEITVLYDFQEVGRIVGESEDVLPAGRSSVDVTLPEQPLDTTGLSSNFSVLMEDARNQDHTSLASAATNAEAGVMQLSLSESLAHTFALPVSVYTNILEATHGKTVANEVLGDGDASQANQEFVLHKAPLTYLLAPTSSNPDGYQSTLEIWIDGIRWQEVPSFFQRGPDESIYVIHADDEGKTHVVFGDGLRGARLPTGINNVVGSYRVGSGKTAPAPGTLKTIIKPYPGLKSVVNPVAPGGGDDPEPAELIRSAAPASVLNFGRAISLQDCEAIASRAPGVVKAQAQWAWDADRQSALAVVMLITDETQKAETVQDGVSDLLRDKAPPGRKTRVLSATPHDIALAVTLEIDDSFVTEEVQRQAEMALIDPDQGLLGINRVRIGSPLFHSEVMAALLAVPGVVRVADLKLGPPDLPVNFDRDAYEIGETEYLSVKHIDLQ